MKEIDMLVPVYYVEVKGFECAFVDLIESWDGSYYGETNVKVHTGPSREVVAGSATLEGTWLERTVAIVSVPSIADTTGCTCHLTSDVCDFCNYTHEEYLSDSHV